jgi:hypothetical protein
MSGVTCEERSQDEDARIALDNGDLPTAIAIYKELIVKEPETYSRYPLLSAALAAHAGLDIFNIVNANFGASQSLLQTMNTFIPTPQKKTTGYDDALLDMKEAVNILKTVPEALRQDITASKFAASCAFQLTLYQSAYSIMLINKYAYSSSGYDPSKLATMTPEDALAILQNLIAAGSVVSGAQGEAASAAVTKAYDAINSQPGSNNQEKIAAYVQANH